MNVAYFDMFSGVSGDMLLGACLDAGVPLDELRSTIEGLGLDGVRLDAERAVRHGIAATRCLVGIPDREGGRRLPEILEILERSDLEPVVKDRSRRIFERLALAEAAVHGTEPDDVHFHEVGALDAVVDVVGGVWCLDRLGVQRVYASRFTLGRGWTDTAHGRLPVPPPAVLELVSGWPVRESAVEFELTTPTGAALVTTLAVGRGMPADWIPGRTGYGAGTRELEAQPNLLRLVLGTVADGAEPLAVVECDLDDLSPELYEPLADALTEAGARDVAWIAVQMKKRRPGVTVRALAPVHRVEAIGDALYRETTTLGYRWHEVSRRVLAREKAVVETSLGSVAVKRVLRPDGTWEARPEYEECRRVARERGMAVRDVMRLLAVELDRLEGD